MNSNTVIYGEDFLQINIATKTPGHTHQQLLTGITAVLKHCIINPVENAKEAEAIATLANLQQALLPAANDLEKLYQPDEFLSKN
jgi:hypothetical protein